MVTVAYRKLPAFAVAGVKRYVSTVDDFSAFWAACHQDGTINRISAMQRGPGPITGAHVIGVSRVENEPAKRSFDFYIAGEIPPDQHAPQGFDRFLLPACTWAICTGEGEMMHALYEAEMHAFDVLLKAGKQQHAAAPELEVYPADGSTVQFWLPIQ